MMGNQMAHKLFSVALLVLMLSGCNGRFVGFLECSQGGAPVWWEYPNSSGSFDGISVNAKNCEKK
jgi:hypothetical protein